MLLTLHLRVGETEALGVNDSWMVTELSNKDEILWTGTLGMLLLLLGDRDGGVSALGSADYQMRIVTVSLTCPQATKGDMCFNGASYPQTEHFLTANVSLGISPVGTAQLKAVVAARGLS